ncbi:MAG: PD-(D/E)XK nuclease family protein [Eubacteriales bacterium]|nr:PD-(D/E)XK nuclease family protein [Eubacteriales bacterium]
MTERIILAPGLNGTELLRSLAKFGVNTIGLRIMGAVELARTALIRSGINVTERFLPYSEEASVIDSFIRVIDYFKNASYADSEQLASALKSMRSLIAVNADACDDPGGKKTAGAAGAAEQEAKAVHEKLSRGKFIKKNEAIIEAYGRFMAELNKSGSIDSISLIRMAAAEAQPVDAEFISLKEYPLSILEKALLETVSCGSFREASITELFVKSNAEISDKVTAQTDDGAAPAAILTEAYGASNEVEDILGTIFTQGIPLDKCTVAVTETNKYAQLFYDYSIQHGFKLTLGCGVPILNSNPARLLKAYTGWETDGYHGPLAIKGMILGEAFNRKALTELFGKADMSRGELAEILDAAGRLRLGTDRDSNERAVEAFEKSGALIRHKTEIVKCLKVLSAELAKPVSRFLKDYSVIRDGHPGRVDRSAVNVITAALDAYFAYSEGGSLEEITGEILKKTVCSENSREGALYITSITGAMGTVRENLFIAGLSADSFPGSPRENYLLLDCDYELFAKGTDAPTSAERIRKKRQGYFDLRNLMDKLGVSVRLSYSCYDLAELKGKNLSSVVTEPAVRKTGYFEYESDAAAGIGRAYNEGKEIVFSEPSAEEVSSACSLEREYSPSSIEVFFSCPRAFMLSRVLGIEEPEEEKPFEIISAAEMGTLVHSMMEYKAGMHGQGLTAAAFAEEGKKRFGEFLLAKRPVIDSAAAADEQAFLKILDNAYRQDPDNEVLSAEEMMHVVHETGVRLKGIPDRVEKRADGSNIIADFKTGRRIKHKEDDIASCLQVVIYAYMTEQTGTPVAGCEYRYVRNPRIIPCRYDDAMKADLSAMLTVFRDALLSGDFPCSEEEESCKHCKFGSFCGKGKS